MEFDQELKTKLFYQLEFLRRNKNFQQFKKEEYETRGFCPISQEWIGFIDDDLLMKLYEFDSKFPDKPIPDDMITFSFPSIKLIHIFQEEECAKIEYNKIYTEENRIPNLNKSRKQEFFFSEEEETKYPKGIPVKVGRRTGWKKPLLSIDFVNKEDSTIMLKISLNRNKSDIHKDIDTVLMLLDKEADLYGFDFERTKKRPIKGAKSIFEKYDILIEVWDKVKKEGKPIYEIAKEKFPEIFKYHDRELTKIWQLRLKGKNTNKLPRDWDEDERDPIDTTSAEKKISRYYKEANRMINEGGWRTI